MVWLTARVLTEEQMHVLVVRDHRIASAILSRRFGDGILR
jgi:hypothetical protein